MRAKYSEARFRVSEAASVLTQLRRSSIGAVDGTAVIGNGLRETSTCSYRVSTPQ